MCVVAADRPGHAILRTVYGMALEYDCVFFVEYFAMDLVMSADVADLNCIAMGMEHGSVHHFGAHSTVFATGGFGRAHQSCNPAHTCTGDGSAMDSRAGVPMRDLEFVRFDCLAFVGYFAMDLVMSEDGAGRLYSPLRCALHDYCDRRFRPGLPVVYPRSHLHRRRQYHGQPRRRAHAGP